MATGEPNAKRLVRDVRWNVVALAVAGGCGILLNYLIGVVYGATALGVFNQVFAFYVVFSQFAVLGVHYSVLKYLAAVVDPVERRAIATSGFVATALTGVGFAGLLWVCAGWLGEVLGSGDVATGIAYAAPGVLFFALSKLTLACLNGLRRMRLYAVFFGGRFVLMILAFALCAALGVDRAALPLILTVAEAATFLLSLPTVRDVLGRVARPRLWRWAAEHVRFGLRGFMSGMFAELNTRVDVLVLGYFASDRLVGAYSFAAILAEGLFQLLVVLRTNFAPILIRLWADGRVEELVETVRKSRNRTYAGALVIGALAVLGYVVVVPLVTTQPELAGSWPYFAVLVGGMVASAGYTPFQPLLLYAGFPGWHTLLMCAIVACNALGNVLLIPPMGALGAAVATALAFVLGVGLLRLLVARRMQLRI